MSVLALLLALLTHPFGLTLAGVAGVVTVWVWLEERHDAGDTVVLHD